MQRKELSVSVRCGGRDLSFQVVAAEKGIFISTFSKKSKFFSVFEKWRAA